MIADLPRSGIGLAFCTQAISAGARVVIADLKLTSAGGDILAANKSKVTFIKCNVSSRGDLEAAVKHAQEVFGDVPDVYAANAGIPESVRLI